MTTDNFFDSKIVVQFIMNAVAPIKLKFIEDDGTETSTAALTRMKHALWVHIRIR